MTIDLMNVAVKIERKHPHDCIISIGRLCHADKNKLLSMFPLAIHSLRCREYGFPFPCKYQMTISVCLPIGFKIHDSDACNLTITDHMIISQTKPSNTYLDILSPWFDSTTQEVSETTKETNDPNKKEETEMKTATLEKCIINDNATILFWSDGTKTVTKTTPGDAFDPEIGIAMGIAKKIFGSKHKFDKYVNATYSDMCQRTVAVFTEKELTDALAENEKIITKAKAKHNAEKAAYITAKNDPNYEGKLPELHSLNGDHSYRFAKIRKDIIMAEIEKRKAKKAAKTKVKTNAKTKTRAKKKKPETEK